MLQTEYGTATNIKSRVNRLSVLSAITSTQQRLKLYNKIPENGLVLYCGEVLTADGKEKKVSIDIEPFKPLKSSLYMCDNRFHTEALKALLEDDEKFGFIIMDGNGALFGEVAGSTRTILNKFNVELPKKLGRGGQSALRFARIRLEKRHNYVRKVAETAVSCFIANDKPTVTGLVLAGSAEFKQQLTTSDLLDPRLMNIIIGVYDISYGGENGFAQAIDLAADSLAGVKFIREKKLLTSYFEEIAKDSGKICYGLRDTLAALEMSAIAEIIVWENLPENRYIIRRKDTGAEETIISTPEAAETNQDIINNETIECEAVVEWLSNNYKKFGCSLHFITDKSPEGSQFCKGFGGIGGIMRYALDLAEIADAENQEFFDDDEGFI